MIRGSSLTSLARRERLLLSCLAFAASLVVLGERLGVQSLGIAGAALAVLGGVVRLTVALMRHALERRHERAKIQRLTKVPVRSVSSIDPTEVGVEAAAPQDLLPGGRTPDYLARDIDQSLARTIERARRRDGEPHVILVGSSKVGKSRSLFEMLERQAPDLDLVAPVSTSALSELLELEDRRVLDPARPHVLWIDDLEPFLGEDLTLHLLRRWGQRFPEAIMVGTYGGKGSDSVASGRTLATAADAILQHAQVIALETTKSHETASILGSANPAERRLIERHGLAAFLVGGPRLERKLLTSREYPGAPECPEGVAVVRSLIEWARCGRVDPLPRSRLLELWAVFLPSSSEPSDELFAKAIAWSLAPVTGSVSLAEYVDGGYVPNDYIVRSKKADPCPPQFVWAQALADISPAQALSVGVQAFNRGRLDDAKIAFDVARKSPSGSVAIAGKVNYGRTLAGLDDHASAIVVFDEVLRESGEIEGVLDLRELAQLFKGEALSKLGRPEDAIDVYQDYLATVDFQDSSDRVQAGIAAALFSKAEQLRKLEQLDDELAVLDQVIDHFGTSEGDIAVKALGGGLERRVVVLGLMGDSKGALRACDDLVTRLSGRPQRSAHQQIAKALYLKAGILARLGSREEALIAFRTLLRSEHALVDTAARRRAAEAYLVMAALVGDREGQDAKLAVYAEMLMNLDEESDPEVRQLLAKAMLLRARGIAEAGGHEDALALYSRLFHDFGGDTDPTISRRVGEGLIAQANLQSGGGRTEDALKTLGTAVRQLDGNDDPKAQHKLAVALLSKSALLAQLDRNEEAVTACADLISRFGEVDEPSMRANVMRALFAKVSLLKHLGSTEEFELAEAELADRFFRGSVEVDAMIKLAERIMEKRRGSDG